MGNSEKKWKGLLHKVGYLKVELDDRKEKLSKFESEIGDKLHEIAPDLAPAPPPPAPKESEGTTGGDEENKSGETEENNEGDPEGKEETPPEEVKAQEPRKIEAFKKLWKQIALKTHPDRNGGDPELSSAYMTALNAWNNGEVEALIDVASDLNIKIQDPSQEMIEALEERASQMEEEIRKHESNMLWAWGHATVDKQSLIVDELLRYKRKKRNA